MGRRTLHQVLAGIISVVAAARLLQVQSQVVVDPVVARFVEQASTSVSAIATEAKRLYDSRCTSSCDQCVMDACQAGFRGDSAQEQCLESFATPDRCPAPGQTLLPDESIVRIAEGVPIDASIDPGALEDACTYSGLTETFAGNYAALPDIRWQYFATVQGVHRTYPAKLWGVNDDDTCRPYDPRRRPWFVSAASGPKNVVLLLDDSSSMGIVDEGEDQQRMQLAVAAAADVLSTLTPNDFVAVARFSDRLTRWGDGQLVRASAEARAAALAFVTATRPGGSRTSFAMGLQEAVRLLEDVIATDFENTRHTTCLSTIVMLTDGEAQDGTEAVAAAASVRDLAPQALLFTYSFGESAFLDDGANVGKQMACAAGGLWVGVTSSEVLAEAMSQYYQFVAGLQAARAGTVVWSDLIVDVSGLGTVVVAAAPVYSDSGVLVGVAGTDLALNDLGSGANLNLLTFLRDRSSRCAAVVPSDCLLQRLRREAARRVGGLDYQMTSVCAFPVNSSSPLWAPALGTCAGGNGTLDGCDARPRGRLCSGQPLTVDRFLEGACCGDPVAEMRLSLGGALGIAVACLVVAVMAVYGWCAGWCGAERADGATLAKAGRGVSPEGDGRRGGGRGAPGPEDYGSSPQQRGRAGGSSSGAGADTSVGLGFGLSSSTGQWSADGQRAGYV